MRWKAALALGLGSYLLFLVLNLPAQQALGWAMKSGSLPLSLTGVSGTIWSGEAESANFERTPLGQLKWQFAPLSLLTGRIGYAIELKDAAEQLSGTLQAGMGGGSYRLRDVQGLILADRLAQLMPQRQVHISGKIDMDQLDLDISDGHLTSAAGKIHWKDASVTSPLALKVGDLQADLTTEENGRIKAKINNLGGTTVIKAEAGLNSDGNFQIDGSVKPGSGADPGLKSALQAIGRSKPDGSFQLKYTGKI